MKNKKTPPSYLKNEPQSSAMAPASPKPENQLSGCKGFTLVELLVVSVFIGVLVTIALASYTSYVRLAQNARAISDIRNIDKRISAYIIENNKMPDLLTDLGTVPTDPWGNPYQFYDIVKGGGTPYKDVTGVTPLNVDYDIYSMGPDGLTAKELTLGGGATSQDDVIRANDGSLVEVGAKF